MKKPDDSYPEILTQFAIAARSFLSRYLPDAAAQAVAFEFSEFLRKDMSGKLYIPKGTAYELAQRNAEIIRDFNGRNHRELASRYGITAVAVYDIIRRARNGNKFKPGSSAAQQASARSCQR